MTNQLNRCLTVVSASWSSTRCNMTKVLYIHGANATPKSLSYIRKALPPHTPIEFSYDASHDLSSTIDRVVEHITEPMHIVSHSLGGIIAVAAAHLATKGNVKSITTISTPFGGSEAANRIGIILPFNRFINNIRTTNPVIRGVVKAGTPVPTLSIITTGGYSPFEPKENDGVVTVESQRALTNNTKVIVPYTHFEVLLDDGVAELVSKFIDANR